MSDAVIAKAFEVAARAVGATIPEINEEGALYAQGTADLSDGSQVGTVWFLTLQPAIITAQLGPIQLQPGGGFGADKVANLLSAFNPFHQDDDDVRVVFDEVERGVFTTANSTVQLPADVTVPLLHTLMNTCVSQANVVQATWLRHGRRDAAQVDSDVINVDGDINNADWLRSRTWDMTTPFPECKIVRTLNELRRSLGENNAPASDADVRAFLRLPAAKAMPQELADEIERAGLGL